MTAVRPHPGAREQAVDDTVEDAIFQWCSQGFYFSGLHLPRRFRARPPAVSLPQVAEHERRIRKVETDGNVGAV
jgi:hypothetical protein